MLNLRPPGYGNFTARSGLEPRAQSRALVSWSDLRSRIPGRLGVVIAFLAANLAVGLWLSRRASDPSMRGAGGLLAMVVLMAAVQYVVKFIGNGLQDTAKQLFLFNVLVDLCVISDVILLAGVVRGWARRTCAFLRGRLL